MTEPAANDEERFDEIIADYLDAVAAGEAIQESVLLTAHPEFADQLRAFFADHRRMGGLLDSAPREEATLPPSGKTRGAGDAPTLAGEVSDVHLGSPEHYGVDPEKCIADYLLLDRVAEGGMGVVYRAKQLSLNRVVALKMIRAGEFADAEEIRRFRVEAEAAAKLTHPGIVPIYQIGEDKGQHFFSMALVDGQSLADMIRQQPMKPRRAAEYVAQVARAVQFAHEQGIIHRDIKPANVLVDKNNQPQVTDFGLAKQITADHELTMSGQILGTASYMSPEQAAGKEVTPLADVYSLGALLYALLTKQPPFTGANPVDILLDVLSKDPASPSTLNVSLSRDLETICMRCLEKDPERRYPSAQALAEDLDRFLDGTPILARPVGRIEKTIRWCRRRPAVATAIFLAGMLCLAAVAYYFKDGGQRIFMGTGQTQTDARSLPQYARRHYQNASFDPASDREELLLLAGQAMLSVRRRYARDASSEALFEALAQRLEAELVEDPQDAALKSALADCLHQLARFRMPVHHQHESGENRVAEEDAEPVRRWLERSLVLLTDLAATHPEHATLAARTADVHASMQRLPGSFQERMAHMLAAGATSRQWDDAYGVVRFALDSPEIRRTTQDIERLKQLAANGDVTVRLELAHAYCEQKKSSAAMNEYLDLLDGGYLRPEDFVQAFFDLALLEKQRPGDVAEFILDEKQNWPRDPWPFYYAMLGVRLADVE